MGWYTEDVTMDAVMEEPMEMEMGTVDGADLSTDLHPDASRKIIYTADVSMESEQFDETIAAIRDLIDRTGGYVSSTSQRGNAADGSRRGNYTIRIPSQRYSEFLDGLKGAGNVFSIYEYTDDITTQYVDVQARISTLEGQRDRLLELSAEAEDIETLLAIETKLGDVQYQLESYIAQMRTLDNQVNYSTVTVSLSEVGKVSEGVTFGGRLIAAFSGSWDDFVYGLQDFIIWLIYAFPTLVILALIGWVLVLIIRRRRKKHPEKMTVRKRFAKKKEEPEKTESAE